MEMKTDHSPSLWSWLRFFIFNANISTMYRRCWLQPGLNHGPDPIWSHGALWQTKAKPAASSAFKSNIYTGDWEHTVEPYSYTASLSKLSLCYELRDLVERGHHQDTTGFASTWSGELLRHSKTQRGLEKKKKREILLWISSYEPFQPSNARCFDLSLLLECCKQYLTCQFKTSNGRSDKEKRL